jgi:hypothetical protein
MKISSEKKLICQVDRDRLPSIHRRFRSIFLAAWVAAENLGRADKPSFISQLRKELA